LDAVQGDDPVARRDRAMLEVLYATGLRISELVGLRLADLDLESGLLRAFGKGSRGRMVPIGTPPTAALVAWLGPGGRPALVPERWARRGGADAVFLNRRGGLSGGRRGSGGCRAAHRPPPRSSPGSGRAGGRRWGPSGGPGGGTRTPSSSTAAAGG